MWAEARLEAYVIAEAGVNHNGSLELAMQLVDAAADAGADAVKFQTFKAERLVTSTARRAAYQSRNTGTEASQFEMLKELELSSDTFLKIRNRCREREIDFISTPFDEESANLLVQLGVPVFKVSSGDLTNLLLLRHMAGKGLPMIVSTGMATLGDIEIALDAIDRIASVPVSLLHCVSNYPADPADANLRAMETLRLAFGRPVGWSDHTEGIAVSIAAVALGATIIEKHLTLDRSLPGPDHAASIEPNEFRAMTSAIRTVELALGSPRKAPTQSEREVMGVARRSIVAAAPIGAGETVKPHHLMLKRPGSGLPGSMIDLIVGRRARRPIQEEEMLDIGMLE